MNDEVYWGGLGLKKCKWEMAIQFTQIFHFRMAEGMHASNLIFSFGSIDKFPSNNFHI
jgi:hypothetical protein